MPIAPTRVPERSRSQRRRSGAAKDVINEDGSITELWNADWSKDYTLMFCYQVGGKPHLVTSRGGSTRRPARLRAGSVQHYRGSALDGRVR